LVLALMPAAFSAAEFAQPECPSTSSNQAGRSPVILSSTAALGSL
jgi:hypothetical protein